ncbi:hypothetical protein [Saccharomonospora piscinae]|nr:hypothetical protein [Saccharomonospora piscinae]
MSMRLKRRLYEACKAGRTPAEALDAGDREDLVAELWQAGMTDVEIATHTRMTTYTTARIRGRLGLRARTARKRSA